MKISSFSSRAAAAGGGGGSLNKSKSKKRNSKNNADASTYTEQGRRMSEALSISDHEQLSDNAFLLIDTLNARKDQMQEEQHQHQEQAANGSSGGGGAAAATAATFSNDKKNPESLLRDQSQLVLHGKKKDALARTTRISSTSEFDLPLDGVDDDDDDADYSTSDGDSSSGPRGGRPSSTPKESSDFAAKEASQVFYARILVFVVLTCSAAAVGYLTYWFISGEEQGDAQQQFQTDANELLDVSNANGRNIMAVLSIFSTLLSSGAANDSQQQQQQGDTLLANHSSSAWPLYTQPDFEKFGSGSRALSGALLLAYTPSVSQVDRQAWEEYSVANQGWIQDGLQDLEAMGTKNMVDTTTVTPRPITEFIYRKSARSFEPEVNETTYSPIWQLSPAPTDTSVVNFNLRNHPTFRRLVAYADLARQAALSEVITDMSLLFGTSAPKLQSTSSNGGGGGGGGGEPNNNALQGEEEDPQSIALLPVFEIPNDPSSPIVAHVVAVIPWGRFLQGILQEDRDDDILVVLEESCGNAFTYVVNGPHVTYLGPGDRHDRRYTASRRSTQFSGGATSQLTEKAKAFLESTATTDSPHCEYTIAVYPSQEYNDSFETNNPAVFTVIVLLVFVFTSAVFLMYDWYVTKRQNKVQQVAAKSTAIVTSLFPAQVRDKLYHQQDENNKAMKAATDRAAKGGFSHKVGHFSTSAVLSVDVDSGGGSATGGGEGNNKDEEIGLVDNSPPIADLFPSATVLFMDIAGFTAWSSSREPSQVFILLETIYRSFDKIAKQRRVFKVETIGDCYLAVCGLPEPCDDHAVVMARFARDCLEKMNELARKLETTLGPDTADLAMRAGLHSGPVTAGVLRGERARFQLFGDTVNTAARMESTGLKKKIQVSQETAELIIAADKANWIRPRNDVVHAKGKGELQTFWLLPRHRIVHSNSRATSEETQSAVDNSEEGASETELGDSTSMHEDDDQSMTSEPESNAVENARIQRLVDYTSEILVQVLKKIACKQAKHAPPTEEEKAEIRGLESTLGQQGICLEEVVEVIELPGFDSAAYSTKNVTIDPQVVSQLVKYVGMIASMYRSNPFHNFDHASHVTQSVSKLLSRIVAVRHIEEAEQLHDHTYGITSDPLTQFAIVFSSLIHDVDHRGVPNFVLVKEDPALAALYRQQAVAEQNSVDVAWNLLMDPMFEKLRGAIYSNGAELKRFRQLVVNSLMATDIFDKQLASLRKQRWENAFFEEHHDEDAQVSINRKATIVIEHIIQASDVSHTMQHWHVYSRWNAKLFQEMFLAYCHQRTNKDPTEGWYNGELWFFDNYVIPLAHKLKECGVFGVSSDEYLQYALANRREWEAKGKMIVNENFERFKGELESRQKIMRRRSLVGGVPQESAPLPTHQ